MSTRNMDRSNDWLGVTRLDPNETSPPSATARVFRWRLLPSDKGWDLIVRVAVSSGADSHDKH